MSAAPFRKMILCTMIWNKKGRAGGEVFPLRNTEIGKVGIMKHLGISNRPFPAALDMEKLHRKITNGQGIGCEGTIVIMQGILVRGSKCIEMGAVNGAKGIFKEKNGNILGSLRMYSGMGSLNLGSLMKSAYSSGDENIMSIFKKYL